MKTSSAQQLIDYMTQELDVSEDAIRLASRQSAFSTNQFPIALWQMGFVSLEQLDSIFDWLEKTSLTDAPSDRT